MSMDDKDRLLRLSSRVEALILKERAHNVQHLLDEVAALQKMTAVEYLARGVHRESLVSNELVGMMARAGWVHLDYDESRNTWRALWGDSRFEGPKSLEAVRAVFADVADTGAEVEKP